MKKQEKSIVLDLSGLTMKKSKIIHKFKYQRLLEVNLSDLLHKNLKKLFLILYGQMRMDINLYNMTSW